MGGMGGWWGWRGRRWGGGRIGRWGNKTEQKKGGGDLESNKLFSPSRLPIPISISLLPLQPFIKTKIPSNEKESGFYHHILDMHFYNKLVLD